MKRIVVGMSGGVDSSMSLLLLKQQGWEPVGVSLKLHEGGHIETAKAVCEKLGIPHYTYDVQKDFSKSVISFLISELKEGRTPNPCAECNRTLKFVKLFEFAEKHGISHVATGHYARSTERGELLRAKDLSKDQTYGLCFLTKEMLCRTVFPLGELTKKEVLSLAKKEGFTSLALQKQSQDLCFVPKADLYKFIDERLGRNPGRIVDTSGNILGRHDGLHFYTVGQRRKLGLKGQYYVKAIDRKNNTLIVTKDKGEILQSEARLSNLHFISGTIPAREFTVSAQVRYHQPEVRSVVIPGPNNTAAIRFEKPIQAVTPGQVCVFYKGDLCLGGGIIT